MKKRYSVIIWSALVYLIGVTWMPSQPSSMPSRVDTTIWEIGGLGMVLAGLFAFVGTRPDARPRSPAILALLVSAPVAIVGFSGPGLVSLIRFFGVPFVLVAVGALATPLSALFVAVMPLPNPSTQPQLAPARVVDA